MNLRIEKSAQVANTRFHELRMKEFRAHVLVRGRVQGVFFRESTRRHAVSLGVSGFVRNLPDGRVEALFVGEKAAVLAAVEFVHRGPSSARVDGVDLDTDPAPGEFHESADFEIRQ
jgi:acylphosphatase